MSEFGLKANFLPTTKLGADGKGERAVIVKQSYAKIIITVIVVALLMVGCLFIDLRQEESTHQKDMQHETQLEEHQRFSKLQAEKTMTQISAQLAETVSDFQQQESDLKIMASRVSYEHKASRVTIMKAIDDTSLTVEDIKKQLVSEFDSMNSKIMVILESVNEKAKDEADEAAIASKRMQNQLLHQMQQQEKRDAELEANRVKEAAGAAVDEAAEAAELASEDAEINGQLHAVFDHVNELAEKMGDEDIDSLLQEENVKEWEQLISHTETGKISYPDAITKMEHILTKNPVALKLAEATGAIELVEEDGGKKGVNELTNFRNLLQQVKRLPEYAAVLEEFTAWKNGQRTMQQILVWTQQQIADKKVDPAWMAKAYEHVRNAKPIATSTRPAASAAATRASTMARSDLNALATAGNL